MIDPVLQNAIAQVSPGKWAVGVSGGADSVALLLLLRDRTDLQLTVAHLDHETRGQASTDDAAFVRNLAGQFGLPAEFARRSDIEKYIADPPANPSALYRACRIELFQRVVADHQLQGVILAHHADDQAEMVLHRLIRGAPATALGGMSVQVSLGGLVVVRPLLGVRRDRLRSLLAERHQPFREDASNASDDYLRNRLRKILADRPGVVDRLLELSTRCAELRDWAVATALNLDESFHVNRLADLPDVVARESAKQWLVARGAPAGELSTDVLDRLLLLCRDASTPSRQHFPGRLNIARRRGIVQCDPANQS
ncbi:hypothetical protein BH10PLA1_BH10PLA1_13380 [soil metagenome]